MVTDLLAAIREIDIGDVAPAVRAELARRWADDALDEHASIAAFARFSLELLAVGAPPDLVADSHAAALDEIVHARCSFAVASLYAGESLGPGPLASATTERRSDLVDMVRATTRDGCIGETVAVAIAAAERDACTIAPLRELLAMIARDEARHAALAWRFVRWGISTAGEVAEHAFADEVRCAYVEWRSAATRDDGPLAAFGRLDHGARERIGVAVGARIVAERDALLDAPDRVIARWIGPE